MAKPIIHIVYVYEEEAIVIWVTSCSQCGLSKAKSNLLQSHRVLDVSPYEVLSMMTGKELIFLEVKNAESDGFQLLRTIKQRFPDVKVVVVYHELDSELALTVLRAGGDDLISVTATTKDLDESFMRLNGHQITHSTTSIVLEHRESSILPALKLIDENLSAPLREDDLAQACQYSPTYFSRLFHNIMGQTLKQYIIHKRLDLACGLLVSDREKISNIAAAAGFNDVSYFSRVFKKYMGCSPGEYRLSQLNSKHSSL